MRNSLPWRVLTAWVVTRAVLLLAVTQVIPVGHAGHFENDVALYRDWSQALLAGHFPAGDDKWQYPPLAALPMVVPHLLPWTYHLDFYLVALLCDLGILLLLWRFAHRVGGGRTGLWAWTVGAALLGPLLLSRYDLSVTLVAVMALAASADPVIRGMLIGVGLAVKVWPVALLVGLRRGREVVAGAGSALAVAAVGCGVAVLLMPNALDFLAAQEDRGLQIESPAATPFALARALGWWDGYTNYQHGAMEAVGPGVATAEQLALFATPAALVLLAVWWVRARPDAATYYDAALTAVLFLVVTSRVLSPQYMTWVAGVAAVVLTVRPGGRGTGQRPVAWLVLFATLLTGIMYPWLEQDYSWTGDLPGTLVLAARNLVLVVAAIVSFVRLWRGTGHSRWASGSLRRYAVPTA
ncbi:glycosyltransferase family 87 protein [Planotetraspora phitsanulokensis]|uniref:glycosyltransferase family 87 protein n=1 Tax=Planotetraspora phitsanulokensis TaxID=575192 RepID=UPI00194E5AD4|nr:glycosyltransferase family 87 protein [Planotetraspora phitsanulokensis]